MNTYPTLDKTEILTELEQKKIITDWLETIAELHDNHSRLTACLNQLNSADNVLLHENEYIGQCPIGQIVTLIRTIEAELEILLLDIDDLNPVHQRDSVSAYKKPVNHIRILQRLNNQAKTVLLLTTRADANIQHNSMPGSYERTRWN